MPILGSNQLLAQQAQQATVQNTGQFATQFGAANPQILTTNQLLNAGSIQSGFQTARRETGEGPKVSPRMIFNAAVGHLFAVTPLGQQVKVHGAEDFNMIDYEA